MARLLNDDRQEERRTQQRMQNRIGNRIQPSVREELESVADTVSELFREAGSVAIDEGVGQHKEALKKAMNPIWRGVMESTGSRVMRQAKSLHGRYYRKQSEEEEAFQQRIEDWVAINGAIKITQIAETTKEQIRGIISRAEREGLEQAEIASLIQEKIKGSSAYRANMIARTEAQGAGQAGMMAAARSSSIPMSKEWISSNDSRTRDEKFDHRRADGETVDRNGTFHRTGEGMDHPGDPSGSAGNVIHCRCGMGFVTA